jgi:hypothetical protein
MKLPGEALLELEAEPLGENRSRLTQTARFQPRGLAGILYWYAVLPLHRLVFEGMLQGIRHAAESLDRSAPLDRANDAESLLPADES